MKGIYIALYETDRLSKKEFPIIKCPKCPRNRSYCDIRKKTHEKQTCKYFGRFRFDKRKLGFYIIEFECKCNGTTSFGYINRL